MAYSLTLLALTVLTSCSITSAIATTYNVVDYGAKPDGQSDSTKALLTAWTDACGSRSRASIYVPAGSFVVGQALFQGPCNNNGIKIYINGTILAPSGFIGSVVWLTFKYVQGLSLLGGTLDARGQTYWACKTAGRSCPPGATSLTISISKNVLVSGLTLLNSEGFQMSVFGSTGVTVQRMNISAPDNSPNTNGVHIQRSSHVTVRSSSIGTGDDCVSMGEGTDNVLITTISCGPGHGISIGSLGGTSSGAGVQNVTVSSIRLTGTQNGIRIKTWAHPYPGFVKNVIFEHIAMNKVSNPIVVDQYYCPSDSGCPTENSGVKISDISYDDIHGSSVTKLAVEFNCSTSNPCSGIRLQDVRLTYQPGQAQAFCRNVAGSALGTVIPASCF